MLLKTCSIKNYRSIFNLKTMELSNNLTTIIGKNNQGKSNILKAINLLFDAIVTCANANKTKRFPFRHTIEYRWNIDFPIQRQNKKRFDQKTIISLEIYLTKDEENRFKRELNIKTSSILKVRLVLNNENDLIPHLELSFKGSSNIYYADDDIFTSDSTAGKICILILQRINFQYIPAIRTDELADDIANNIIALELSQLAPQKRERLEAALKQIAELQKPILKNLEKNLSTTLKDFVPEIKKVSLYTMQNNLRRTRSYNDETFYIKIDDGSDTMLAQKGDGIKSLITLGMMRQKGKSTIGKGLILAIEEPESHLHPEAIRQISRVINDISENNQIIITSHSPLFVNRNNISDNIIVEKNTATKANNMKEIRETLGVIASDNLINSEFTIVVEGATDKNILLQYINKKSTKLANYIKEKRLCFEVLNGVTNLNSVLNKLSNMASKYFCVLDSDQISQANVKMAIEKAFLSSNHKEVSYYTILGKKECELEDLINIESYKDFMKKEFEIDITNKKIFKTSKDKWSKRIEKALIQEGKIFEETELHNILTNIKKYISTKLDIVNDNIINETNSSINKIIEQIENYF